MGTIEIKVDSSRALLGLEEALRNTPNLMRKIAGVMADSIEENFEQQGRPRWLALAPSTLKDREKKGYTGKILQRTGGLAASVAQDSGDDFARISIAKRYAAIQNFGGLAGRGGRTQIPARPFAKLSDTDIDEIQKLVLNHFTIIV